MLKSTREQVRVIKKAINKITINDVAKLAGVSITTVSRVINGNYPVKEETREKVERAISELEFVPNDLAVSMIKKKTNTIGVIVPSISNIFFSTLVKGITDVLDLNEYTTLLCTSKNNEEEIVTKLINRRVDGIIIADSNVQIRKEFYKKIQQSIPLIFVNGYEKEFNNVSCDQESGTLEVLNFLSNKGHSDILFVRGEENSYSYELKEKIYKEYTNNQKILVVENGNKDDAILNTTNAICDYIKNNGNFTAVFACNDLMGIGVLEGLKKSGISVPNDVSVVGFDDIFLCDLVTPKLTSVKQNSYKLGKIASKNILQLIEQSVKIDVLIESELIIRESTN